MEEGEAMNFARVHGTYLQLQVKIHGRMGMSVHMLLYAIDMHYLQGIHLCYKQT